VKKADSPRIPRAPLIARELEGKGKHNFLKDYFIGLSA
jgi:hypothetical protein